MRPSYVIAAAATPFLVMFAVLFGLILLGGLGERLDRRSVLGNSGPAQTGSRRWSSTTSAPRPVQARAGRLRVSGGDQQVETEFGTDLAVSSAGAVGWMQFEPATCASTRVSVTTRRRQRIPTTHRTRSTPRRDTCKRAARRATGRRRSSPTTTPTGTWPRSQALALRYSGGTGCNLSADISAAWGVASSRDAGADHGRTSSDSGVSAAGGAARCRGCARARSRTPT